MIYTEPPDGSFDDIVCAFLRELLELLLVPASAPGYIYFRKSFSVKCESFSVSSMS